MTIDEIEKEWQEKLSDYESDTDELPMYCFDFDGFALRYASKLLAVAKAAKAMSAALEDRYPVNFEQWSDMDSAIWELENDD